MKIPHVHRKSAKGKTYLYFDTGARNAKGRAVLTRLPDPSHPDFGRKLADAQRTRTMRGKIRDVITVSRLADMFEASPKWRDRLSMNTKRNYRIYLDVLREEIGTAPADEVTREDAMVLLDKLAERPSAANMTVRTLGALYSWALKRGHVKANPVKAIEYHEEGEHAPWPQDLLENALKADDHFVRLSTNLLFYTGQRVGDVLSMQWSSIQNDRILVLQQKTDKMLAIKLHRDLAAVLAETPRWGLTIMAQANSKPWSEEALRTRLQAFAQEHGAEVVPHGLRKNAVNGLLEAECSVAEVAAITGQSLPVIVHYAKLRDQTKLGDSAILKLERRNTR